jgi:hypothetical protein
MSFDRDAYLYWLGYFYDANRADGAPTVEGPEQVDERPPIAELLRQPVIDLAEYRDLRKAKELAGRALL